MKNQKKELIHLDWGFIDESYNPSVITQLLELAIQSKGYQLLQYNTDQGIKELRHIVSDFLIDKFAIKNITAENICITNGAIAGLDLIARYLLHNEYDSVYFEPLYDTAIESLKINSRRVFGIELNIFSPEIISSEIWDQVEQVLSMPKTKLFYIVPNFQNPTGITFRQEDRIKILELCRKYNVYVVEDDPYKLYNFESVQLPENFINCDIQKENTIYLNSISKLFFPGIRIGFVIGNKDIIDGISKIQKYTTSSSNLLMQGIAIEAIKKGVVMESFHHYFSQIKTKRQMMLLELAEKGLGNLLDYTIPQGGFYIWCRIKDQYFDTQNNLVNAKSNGVSYVPGAIYFTKGNKINYLRLAYSQIDIKKISEAVKRLKETFETI